MGQTLPNAARRFLEQQSEELPFGVSRLQRAGQQERQHRVSGCGCRCERSSLVRTSRWESVGRTEEESRSGSRDVGNDIQKSNSIG